MRRAGLAFAASLLMATAAPGLAQEISFNGMADLRLIRPSDQRSWMDGGLGKFNFAGGGDQHPDLRLGGLFLDTKLTLDPAFDLFTSLRHDPRQEREIDALEAYGRYRTSLSDSLEGTLKLGAFWPPISLENEGIGWTSPWTLSSSAINTWVGEELRTIGGEATIEWRHSSGALQVIGALFGYNGPAGTLLSYRGWSIGDRSIGLGDKIRQPDTVARRNNHAIPMRSEPWVHIGGSLSWYGGLAWREEDLGRLMLLYWDNKSDPREFKHDEFGWETKFTSLSLETYVGETVLLAQAMIGSTEFGPSATFTSLTRFQSAYLLAGRYFGNWSVAGRIDAFATQEDHTGRRLDLSERGHALTAALNWRPQRWLRLTAEATRIDSYRGDRVNDGVAPRAIENQIQFATRIFF
jgi:hypothetical protein